MNTTPPNQPEQQGQPESEQWRMLKVGEIIANRDEWQDLEGKWHETGMAGLPYGTENGQFGTYRRRIAPQPAPSVEQAGPVCKTCKGYGFIPHTRGQTPESFEQGEYDCPDCAQPAPVAEGLLPTPETDEVAFYSYSEDQSGNETSELVVTAELAKEQERSLTALRAENAEMRETITRIAKYMDGNELTPDSRHRCEKCQLREDAPKIRERKKRERELLKKKKRLEQEKQIRSQLKVERALSKLKSLPKGIVFK